MITHCVFIRYRAETDAAARQRIYAAVEALKPRIPGMLDVIVSPNVSPEGLDKGHSEGFIVTFADAAARDAYLVDEEHAKVGKMVVAAAEGGLDGLIVYDLEH
ncbi:Dabb family protein [Kaistia geumhonensis]|uniref:Stress-response A/B barrel domain-containing protein n=1 Tax=Kaistia geumhonensis TaxID=410839 RepID=A0ABU0M637_9HYPH|nr:Dabb family protein [Kaistia geumhonensis]MCX5478351.1 Dabb family protein [Kaistia geumhonensis]MDQ0516431.1 hypothetical protein [Kaistia geumhonensis]